MLGKVQLPEQTVGSNFIPPGTDGVIGSETLINYNPVLVDYTDGELFLGQGQQTQTQSDPAESPSSSGWPGRQRYGLKYPNDIEDRLAEPSPSASNATAAG